MTAVRMSNAINSKGEVHSFKEYMLIKMLEDLPKYKLNEYLEMLLDSGAKEIFADQDMTNTAEEFLENSLNSSETSRKLFLHRNTLTYRLDKIERATGLNIRKFSDAVTFRLITILSKLVR
jgi:carbohydrate diacid regulator